MSAPRQTPQDGNTVPARGSRETPQDGSTVRDRVEHMLSLAKTKTDLVELVRMLDARNVALQRVRDDLAHQLAQTRQETR